MKHLLRCLILLLCGCVSTDNQNHILWRIDGPNNTVYLLGSVHLLRPEDYPLPVAFNQAYADAEQLLMELDMDDLDPVQARQLMVAAGIAENKQSLREVLGEQAWAKAANQAQNIGIDLSVLNSTEPWFAALIIVETQMLKLGYDPSLGVELFFTRRAQQDGKPINGLETIEQQLGFFAGLPVETQTRFFQKALDDAEHAEQDMLALVQAWKNGDYKALEQELKNGFVGFPDVYQALVQQRNIEWAHTIQTLLSVDEDYLVIVGALHLIGADSVIELMRERGYRVQQL